ncbi:MAG: hypothetical protein KDC92_02785 [Bacteroidetes bacterium]|nr:hypothetical protein [Bacteroidota bacterium]
MAASMRNLLFIILVLLGAFQSQAQRKYGRQQAIGFYVGLNGAISTINLQNKAFSQEQLVLKDESTFSRVTGFQFGLQYIGRKPELTLLALQISTDFYNHETGINNIPINGLNYQAAYQLSWRETGLGARVVRLFGFHYNKPIPVYLDLNYNRLRTNQSPALTLTGTDGPANYIAWRNGFNDLSHGVSSELGFYFKYLNIGIKATHFPSIFKTNQHLLQDGFFNEISKNNSYSNFNAISPTSLTRVELKLHLNLYLLTWGRCSAGIEGFSIGHRYDFNYFWKAGW